LSLAVSGQMSSASCSNSSLDPYKASSYRNGQAVSFSETPNSLALHLDGGEIPFVGVLKFHQQFVLVILIRIFKSLALVRSLIISGDGNPLNSNSKYRIHFLNMLGSVPYKLVILVHFRGDAEARHLTSI
ncbi:hypothetical protein TorRG33x02_318670, partial [Trema orientale]